jgi:hypothetical protein
VTAPVADSSRVSLWVSSGEEENLSERLSRACPNSSGLPHRVSAILMPAQTFGTIAQTHHAALCWSRSQVLRRRGT